MNRISMKDVAKAKATPTDPLTIPPGIDMTTFFTPAIPESVYQTVPLLHSTAVEHVVIIITMALDLFVNSADSSKGASSNDINKPDALKSVPDSTFTLLLSGLFCIIKTAIRTKVHAKALAADLLKMHLPEPIVTGHLVPGILARRTVLESAALAQRVRFPTLQKLRWRVDVTISSGLLSRVMRPNLLMQMILSNGRIRTFEVSIEQFNQLRYGVAKLLHDMRALERHPIMKVVSELERRDCEDRSKLLA